MTTTPTAPETTTGPEPLSIEIRLARCPRCSHQDQPENSGERRPQLDRICAPCRELMVLSGALPPHEADPF